MCTNWFHKLLLLYLFKWPVSICFKSFGIIPALTIQTCDRNQRNHSLPKKNEALTSWQTPQKGTNLKYQSLHIALLQVSDTPAWWSRGHSLRTFRTLRCFRRSSASSEVPSETPRLQQQRRLKEVPKHHLILRSRQHLTPQDTVKTPRGPTGPNKNLRFRSEEGGEKIIWGWWNRQSSMVLGRLIVSKWCGCGKLWMSALLCMRSCTSTLTQHSQSSTFETSWIFISSSILRFILGQDYIFDDDMFTPEKRNMTMEKHHVS